MTEEAITLWRPVGSAELALLERAEWRAWPPRLPEQPIFYPVTNEAYAILIARDWNTKVGDRMGYVTKFAVRKEFLKRYQTNIVGARQHEEYWIPAEDLEELNANIVGHIELVGTYTEGDRLTHEAKVSQNA